MFRNIPRSPTGLSPVQILFGHEVRDSLLIQREQLARKQRFNVETQLQEVRQLRENAKSAEPTRKLPLLYPG